MWCFNTETLCVVHLLVWPMSGPNSWKRFQQNPTKLDGFCFSSCFPRQRIEISSSRQTSIFPWFFHGFSYNCSMVFPWFSHGASARRSWFPSWDIWNSESPSWGWLDSPERLQALEGAGAKTIAGGGSKEQPGLVKLWMVCMIYYASVSIYIYIWYDII